MTRTANKDAPVNNPHRLELTHDDSGKDSNPETEAPTLAGLPNIDTGVHSHSEHAVLKIANAIPKLQEGERNPQRDERVDEESAEDIVGRAPELLVVALDDVAELVPERRRVCVCPWI